MLFRSVSASGYNSETEKRNGFVEERNRFPSEAEADVDFGLRLRIKELLILGLPLLTLYAGAANEDPEANQGGGDPA